MVKRKQSGIETPVLDTSLNRLLDEGPPPLRKENIGLQSSSHVEDTGHEPAAVTHTDYPFLGDELYVQHAAQQQSHLLLNLGRRSGLIYQNETEVQSYVVAALRDALETQGLFDDLAVRPEISIFAYRPDIIVVSHSLQGIVLVIEVKKPGNEVFTCHDVGGQVYDYLVGLLGMGDSWPFVVLTSYDAMCIAHLNDNGASREILQRNAVALNESLDRSLIDQLSRTEDVDEIDSCPDPKANRVLHCDEEDRDLEEDDEKNEEEDDEKTEEEDKEEEEDSEYAREVYYSQIFGPENMIQALVLAVRCGLESLRNSTQRDLPRQGGHASGACAVVNENGMVWRDLPSTLAFDYNTFPGPTTSFFYLWRHLGRGKKGQAFLACNSTGRACVAKFYLLDDPTLHRQTNAQERARIREIMMKSKQVEANTEKERWTNLYGVFRDQVRVLKLNNLWCLLMPYMDPIMKADRSDRLDEVKECLQMFKSRGLRYRDDDLMWRHVGIRNNRVYLFDLGSLEPCSSEDNNVDVQISRLQNRI
jgi:hypothetical protein